MKQAICGRLETTATSSRSAGPIAWLYEAALDILKGLAACCRWHICATLLDRRVGSARRRSVGSAKPAAHNQTPAPDTLPCELPRAFAALRKENLLLPSDCQPSHFWKTFTLTCCEKPQDGAGIPTLLSPWRENATNRWETDLIMFAFSFFLLPPKFPFSGRFSSVSAASNRSSASCLFSFFSPNPLSGVTFQVGLKTSVCTESTFTKVPL